MTLLPITKPIYRLIRYVNNVLLTLLVIVISYVVFARFVLNNSPSWGEEFSLMIMVWICLLSPPEALHENRHLAISLLQNVLPGPAIRIIDAFNHLLVLGFAGFMMIYGTQLAQMTVRNILPGMGVSASWLYAAVPVAGAVLALAAIDRIVEILSIPGSRYRELGCKD